MAKGESIESLLEPSLRVSRPVAACSRCRSAKIKCTWGISACSACERSGKATSCTSANEEFARGNERSYVAALEAAAERLQRKIDATKAGHALSQPGAGSRRSSKARKISGSQRKEASDVNELVSDFGFLTVNATSRDFQGFTSSMSFAKLLLAMAVKSDTQTRTTLRLPPRHFVMQSTARYFDQVFVILPFFSEIEFMASMSRVYQDAASSSVAPLDFWYVRLILAISQASQSQTRGDEYDTQASQHISAAMQLAEHVLRPGSIAGLQALLLLLQYAQLDPERFDSWYLIGMASRLMVDLGLHCELPAEARISPDEINMRRRVFHSVYALDRLISISTGRPFSFTDDSAPDVRLPEFASDTKSGNPSGLFLRSMQQCLYLFDIRRIQSAFYQTTRFAARREWTSMEGASYTASTTDDVDKWHGSIPSTFSLAQRTLLNLEYLYSQILILVPHQRRPTTMQSEADRTRLFEYCCQFTELLQPATFDTEHLPFISASDISRAAWVGRQFLKLLWSDFDHVLQLGKPSAASTCGRALNCFRHTTDILDIARLRWDNTVMRQQFEQESAVLATRLTNRLQDFSSPPSVSSYTPGFDPLYNEQSHTDPNPSLGHQQDAGQWLNPGTRRVYEFIGNRQQ